MEPVFPRNCDGPNGQAALTVSLKVEKNCPASFLEVDSISRLLPADGSLLDIGGGVGPIQHDLFDCGLGRAVQVDASRAYLDASKAEAAARGHAG